MEENESIKPGTSGVWWHEGNPGPIAKLDFIKQMGHMRFTRINLDDSMKPHFNDGIEIHYIHSGKYDWVIEDKTVELLPDDVSITAPWQINGSPSGKMDLGEISWIVIKPQDFTETNPLKLGRWSQIPNAFQQNIGKVIAEENGLVLRNAKSLKRYFLDLQFELKNQQSGYELVVKNLIESLLIELHRLFESRKQQIKEGDSFILAFAKMISSDLNKKWNVDDLALHFGMGKTKFTEEVRRLTGYPPNSYIINLKLEKAKQMLQDPHQSLSQIGYTCGFSSLQHFTSSFSQRTGISPGVFRKGVIK
jgi:AraC-like DNA-binding protein